MAFYDTFILYPMKKADLAATMTLVCSLLLPFLLQLSFVLFYQLRLKRDIFFQEFGLRFKKSTFVLLLLSFMIGVRFFKLIYSNVLDRFDLSILR